MADNITLTTGQIVATNEIGGVHHQRNKMQWGGPGTANDVSEANPLPVEIMLGGETIGKLGANTSGVLIGQVELAAGQSLAQFAGQAIALGTGTINAGTLRVTLATDQSEVAVTPKPAASGGTSLASAISTADTNATVVKASPGQVYGAFITNNGSSARYVKLYNKASTPDENDTPIFRAMIPAGGGIHPKFPLGLACGTGISYRITAGIADNNTGAIVADECCINVEYA